MQAIFRTSDQRLRILDGTTILRPEGGTYRPVNLLTSLDLYLPSFDVKRAIRGRLPHRPSLERMMFDGIARTPCGCKTEPDGFCPHGMPSWIRAHNLI